MLDQAFRKRVRHAWPEPTGRARTGPGGRREPAALPVGDRRVHQQLHPDSPASEAGYGASFLGGRIRPRWSWNEGLWSFSPGRGVLSVKL
jgi:hypothetical protein